MFGLVEGSPSDQAVDRLKQLLKYLKMSVKVISVVVDSHENAYTIFETLNHLWPRSFKGRPPEESSVPNR